MVFRRVPPYSPLLKSQNMIFSFGGSNPLEIRLGGAAASSSRAEAETLENHDLAEIWGNFGLAFDGL